MAGVPGVAIEVEGEGKLGVLAIVERIVAGLGGGVPLLPELQTKIFSNTSYLEKVPICYKNATKCDEILPPRV